MKTCETRIILRVGLVSLLLILISNHAQAKENGPIVSNVTGAGFTVSWVSSRPCVAIVAVSDDAGYMKNFYDDRGKDFASTLHYVTVRGLRANRDYAFVIHCGGMDEKEGRLYPIRTGPNLIPVGSVQPAGRIFLADGYTPASEAIVYVTVSGPAGPSAPLSTLVDENGYWFVELINARTADHQKPCRVIEGQREIVVFVNGGENGSASLEGLVVDNQGGTRLYEPLILK